MYVCELTRKNPGCVTPRKIYELDGVSIAFSLICKKGCPLKIRITQNRKSKLIGLKYFMTENKKNSS